MHGKPRYTKVAIGLISLLAFCSVSDAKQNAYQIQLESAMTPPGIEAEVGVILDSSSGINLSGWSYGVCHSSAELTLQAITSGDTTQTSNGGGAPEFESLDMESGGFTQGVIICFMLCSPLLPGADYELARATYSPLGGIGSVSTVNFCATIGVPPVEVIVVEPSSAQVIPDQLSGEITILDPSITGLNCVAAGSPCACNFELSWTNAFVYDAIEVRIDGVLATTLSGTATTYSLPDDGTVLPGQSGSRQVCLTPIIGGQPSVSTCCDADCTVDPAPSGGILTAEPAQGPTGCEVSLSWSGFTGPLPPYTATITVDGSVVQSGVAGNSALVTLPSDGPHDVCVSVAGSCGVDSTLICETVECIPLEQFIRGDANVDAMVNVADGVTILNFLFLMGALGCIDAADSNDSGALDLADAIYVFTYLFVGGAPPPAPGLSCGVDPSDTDPLDCNDTSACP